MNAALDRRTVLRAGSFFLAFAVAAKGSRALALASPRPQAADAAAAAADGRPAFAPNAFIRIDRTGPVRLVMPNIEMGQGTYTGEATMMAEELDIGLDQIVLEHAPPNEALYAMPGLQMQATGGSTSTAGGWDLLREAGAVGRSMLVNAAAARWGMDPASCTTDRGVVHHAASGRSAAYGDLAAEAARQPVPTKVTLKDASAYKLIGKPMRRLDTAGKVDGSTQFGIDARVPGMLVATLMQCPSFGGRLKSVDDGKARAIAGVRDIVRLTDAVAVTGTTFWAAKCGLEALDIEWDVSGADRFDSDQLTKAMDAASLTGKTILAREVGSVDQEGDRFAQIYQIPALAHATMEPANATVHVRADACEIWVGTQVPTRAVDAAAKITGLPPEKIIVHNHYLGGGFGRRLEIDMIERAVSVAKGLPYPVKLIWTREEDIRQDVPRPPYYDRIAAVLDGEGYPIAWTDRITSDSVARRWAPVVLRPNGLDSDVVEGAEETPYDLPNLRVDWVRHDMPGERPVGWWRGVGPTHNLFKVESFIDELAHRAGKDPLAYRRALIRKNPRVLAVLNLAAEKIGWGDPLPPRVGRGIAVGMPFGSNICAITEVEVTPQGEVRLRRCVVAVDTGIVVNPNTIEAQVQGGLIFGWTGALYSELTYRDGAIEQGNFNDYRMLRIDQTPRIEVHGVASTEKPGGVGELATAIAAPTLGNAIFAATGVRIRRLPIDRSLLVQDQSANKVVMAGLGLGVGALAVGAALAGNRPPAPSVSQAEDAA